MKTIVTLLLISMTLFANPLQTVSNSFSDTERELLLKEFYNSSSTLHTSNIYQLKRGWNKLTTPENGIYPDKSFKDISKIKYVVTYDDVSKYWAMYAPDKQDQKDSFLFLKYLEPNVTFFILAKEDLKVQTYAKEINQSCLKLMNSPEVDTILSSVLNKGFSFNDNKTMSMKTRYLSHLKKGIYDDTRILLIYKKQNSKEKATYKYGPGEPRANLVFTKEYEAKKFFIYDYKLEKCFAGVFPSPKIPPFPTLREIK